MSKPLCRCKICNCGRCRCPEPRFQPQHYDADSLASTTKIHYPPHAVVRPERYRPQEQQPSTSGMPFIGESTYKSNHISHAVRPAQLMRPNRSENPLGTDNTIDYSTESRRQFDNKGRAARETLKPQNNTTESNTHFDGQSTVKSDFQRWNTKPATPVKFKNSYAVGQEDRDFQSENKRQFTGARAERSKNYKPQQDIRSTEPFEACSVTTSDYKSWHGAKPSTPVRFANQFASTAEDRDFKSENKRQFTGTPAERLHSYKPQPRNDVNQAKFEGISTTANDYKQHERVRCPAESLPATHTPVDNHYLFLKKDSDFVPFVQNMAA